MNYSYIARCHLHRKMWIQLCRDGCKKLLVKGLTCSQLLFVSLQIVIWLALEDRSCCVYNGMQNRAFGLIMSLQEGNLKVPHWIKSYFGSSLSNGYWFAAWRIQEKCAGDRLCTCIYLKYPEYTTIYVRVCLRMLTYSRLLLEENCINEKRILKWFFWIHPGSRTCLRKA
jgi:hypothetical protein